MADLYRTLLELRDQGEPAALATVIEIQGSAPGSECMKMLVTRAGRVAGTIGGGCVEAEVIDACREAIARDKSRVLEFTLTAEETGEAGLICGGTVRVFVEPVVAPTCYLFGGGHVGRRIAQVAHLAGFRVVVVDDREAFASPERFPEAARTLAGDPLDLARTLVVGPHDHVVIATRSHAFDRTILEWAITTEAAYIGMIGSRRKVLATFKAGVDAGVDPAAYARVMAPMGLDIGAVTAEEIAVAVVAEMIAHRRRNYRPARNGPRRPHALWLTQADVASDGVGAGEEDL